LKAIVYTGAHCLEYHDVPDPVAGRDDVLVAVEAVGICGSDMHAWHGHDERRPPPLILGHEAAGRIVAGPRKGQRVTINPLVTCGVCDACLSGRTNLCAKRQIISMPPREGAFCELVAIPERNVVEVPVGLAIEKAALAEPIAVAWHAALRAARASDRPLAAASCVVLGGGAIGLAAALCLKQFGASDIHVAESNAARRATAEAAGPFRLYQPGEAGEPPAGGAEIVIDAVGSDATRAAASRLVCPGGVVVHVGLQGGASGLDIRRMTLQEVTFIGTYTYSMVDFREVVAAIAAGRLGALDWFEERTLQQAPGAFADLDAGRTAAAKIVLRP
jgi:L-iditol 2-dehydrogenase